jgi:uncharacterized metal-binding protein
MVFACSGAADVGEITDRAARQLQREREAFMCCTAAIAADVPAIVAKARGAERVLAIDGCAELCAQKILRRAGFEGFPSMRLDELGMEKGKTGPTDEVVDRVVDRARELVRA